MSASEKLKELDEVLQGAPSPNTILALRDALPQIVAVVEAAENAVTVAWTDKATDEQNEILRQRADAIPAALSALEEALS